MEATSENYIVFLFVNVVNVRKRKPKRKFTEKIELNDE